MSKSVPDCEPKKGLSKVKRILDTNRSRDNSRKVKQAKIDTYSARAPKIESVVQTNDLTCVVDIIMKKLNNMSVITQDPPSTPLTEHAANIAMIQEMSKDVVALNNAQHREKLGSSIDNLLKSNMGNSACLILANNALSNIEKCHFQMDTLKNEENTLNDKGKKIAAQLDDSVSSIKDLLEHIQHKEKAAADIVEQIQKLKHQKKKRVRNILEKDLPWMSVTTICSNQLTTNNLHFFKGDIHTLTTS